MSVGKINATYKYAIVAIEAASVVSDITAGDTTITISGNYATATPFVVGNEYLLMDDSYKYPNDWVPNYEYVTVTDISGITAVANSDYIGYVISGTLTIGKRLGTSTGTSNAYDTDNRPKLYTPGVEVCPQKEDFDLRIKDIQDNPKIEFDDESASFSSGDDGKIISIPGTKSGEISFTERLGVCVPVSTIPPWEKLMRITGHHLYVHTNKGISFYPSSFANEVTATVWVFYPESTQANRSAYQNIHRYRGCHGGNGCSIGASKIGDAYTLTAKLNGVYVGCSQLTTSNIRLPSGAESRTPEVFINTVCRVPRVRGLALGAGPYADIAAIVTSLTLSIGSYFYISSTDGFDTTDGALTTLKGRETKLGDVYKVVSATTATFVSNMSSANISSWNLDMGGTVNPYVSQSNSYGIEYYATTNRDPKLTINPYMLGKDLDDINYAINNVVQGPIQISSNASKNRITLNIQRSQLMSPSYANREGFVNTNRTYRCLRNSDGIGYTGMSAYSSSSNLYTILVGTTT